MSYSILFAWIYEYIYIILKYFAFVFLKTLLAEKIFWIVICMNRHIWLTCLCGYGFEGKGTVYTFETFL